MSEERPTGWEEADRWFADDPGGAGRGEGGGGGEEGSEPEGPPPVPRCEVCGAELEPDQTYCLECGSPTPLAPRLRRGGRTAAILAGAMVILGLGAGALAYAVVSDDDDDAVAATATAGPVATAPTAGATIVPPPLTGPLPADTSVTIPTTVAPTAPATAPTGFETVTGPTTAAPATTQEETDPVTEPDPPPAPDTGSSDWPSGETAWTAVLSSVRSEPDARAASARLPASGEPAGVLFSSDYPGLKPGYWVVFSGSFPGRAAAESHANGLSSQFPGAYPRRIEG